ncbi:Hypothetical protein SMAX5B_008892 [Scophthalmus maximus]|uniref:Uncharacterized protein n=1 Tax=Scophthalmus maximus TaxID=52904 RepID=A0A2U9C6K0_SCOMX|nr:Hypothetical protein SMAX5B_008892 [Scophthalmus maximus]KAF0039421.1 hypothetical protein F2P81_007656 [Scophthalmus maximus]
MGSGETAEDEQKDGVSDFVSDVRAGQTSCRPLHPQRRASHARNSRSGDVIVLGANATTLLCPPLSPATIKRTPRRRAALRRQRAAVCGSSDL